MGTWIKVMKVHFPEEEMQKNHKHFNTYSTSLVIRERNLSSNKRISNKRNAN